MFDTEFNKESLNLKRSITSASAASLVVTHIFNL